ncbi:MAG: hypothetical protein HY865_22610 [Chloroflexi bacterium]|nr:hypothetical protein [Chloroflexota bacterium]
MLDEGGDEILQEDGYFIYLESAIFNFITDEVVYDKNISTPSMAEAVIENVEFYAGVISEHPELPHAITSTALYDDSLVEDSPTSRNLTNSGFYDSEIEENSPPSNSIADAVVYNEPIS